MDALSGLLYGFTELMDPQLLLFVLIGAFAGTLVGVLPGLGPVAGAAIILPLTFSLPPVAGMIMIIGVYVGAMYGGSTTAVLLNMPGEAASVVATIDGYKRTQMGRAGSTLAIMAFGSFIAGTVGVILVMFFAPALSSVTLALGPPEYFALTAGGLILLGATSAKSLMSGMFPAILGVIVGTVGIDLISNEFRFTGGVHSLSLGISLVPVAIGLFGLPQLLLILEERSVIPRPRSVKLRELMPTRQEWKRSLAPWMRGSAIGSLFGLLPGPSATLSSYAAYRAEAAFSKHRDELGKGAVEGVASPEAANNAAAVTGLVPALSLGLPFSATYALMLAALIVQGIQPGPLFIIQNEDMFWTIIAGLWISGILLLILNVPLISVWVSILRIPRHVLFPAMILIGVIGAYSVNLNMIDVYILFGTMIVGYGFAKIGFSPTSFVIGLVLGPFIERYFREALWISQGDASTFVDSWISVALWILIVLVLVGGAVVKRWRAARLKGADATRKEAELKHLYDG